MAMKKLPSVVQSLFSLSNRINTYKRAIEELVYNSLDAKSTSIAIRLNIQENAIQVIDNGSGVTRRDLCKVGQRHMTSKTVDLATLKGAPNNYGFRGLSLASLIEISQAVTITSRTENSTKTYVKTFYKGIERDVEETAVRSSKGTTVDIQGFLFNQPIQKNSVNFLTEIQDIKHFLEHLALVHNNISISLRDNTKNEIIFQINKCRDIYQTLSTLFGIDKGELQELTVEKRTCKVTAYIGKKLSEDKGHHWIYLNGRFMPGCRLHNILESNLSKFLCLNKTSKKIKVAKGPPESESINFKKNLPFYFVFITCPYSDYDVNEVMKNTLVFNNWEEITKLLEKVVKFYFGDVKIKEVKEQDRKSPTKLTETKSDANMKDEIKKIINKYLMSNSKTNGVSQMQNGIKGKMVKRTKKKGKDVSLSKLLVNKNKDNNINTIQSQKVQDTSIEKDKGCKNIESCSDNIEQMILQNESNAGSGNERSEQFKKKRFISKKLQKSIKPSKLLPKSPTKQKAKATINPLNTTNNREYGKNKRANKVTSNKRTEEKDKPIKQRKINNVLTEKVHCKNSLIDAFQQETGIVKERCNMLAKTVDQLLQSKNTRKRRIYYNESSQYSTITTDNKNITVKKRVGEMIIQDVVPLPPKFNVQAINHLNNKMDNMQYSSSHDLLQTILKSQPIMEQDFYKNIYTPPNQNRNDDVWSNGEIQFDTEMLDSNQNNSHKDPKLTYESHIYYNNVNTNLTNDNNVEYTNNNYQRSCKQRFITHQSRENFVSSKTKTRKNLLYRSKFNISKRQNPKAKNLKIMKRGLQYTEESSYTIEFSKNGDKNIINHINQSTDGADFRYTIASQRTNCLNMSHTQQIDDDILNIPHDLLNNSIHPFNQQISSEIDENNLRNESLMRIVENSYFGTYTIDKTGDKSIDNQIDQSTDGADLRYTISSELTNEHCKNKSHTQQNDDDISNIPHDLLDSTYTLNQQVSSEIDANILQNETLKEIVENSYFVTYTIDKGPDFETNRLSESINLDIDDNQNNGFQNQDNIDDNLVFVSESRNQFQQEAPLSNDIDPLNVCETILNSCDILDTQIELDENSHVVNCLSLDSLLQNEMFSSLPSEAMATFNEVKEKSHHFELVDKELNVFPDYAKNIDSQTKENQNSCPLVIQKVDSNRKDANVQLLGNDGVVFQLHKDIGMTIKDNNDEAVNDFEFNFKNRPRFIPKGLSPIFENCNTKNACNYDLDEEYFEDDIYGDFVKAVETNTEIFEANIENVNNFTTKDIVKVNAKLKKDNATLNFEGDNLKDAKVLGQVDSKFIAAKMSGKSGDNLNGYLVLFDQHAVHERIRLETNLAEYLTNEQWKSVDLDELVIKLGTDEVLYLHNYKEKFQQLGLKWKVSNNLRGQISITAIPEAILGKHPRQVDIIIKAVKNLISEEIEVLKSQKGSISVYPKSIMDLVFSEACRYAIKFGDHLSGRDCVELLSSLSDCKTPFQCAHGRPVMAVIMKIQHKHTTYKINLSKLKSFKKSMDLLKIRNVN